MAKRENLPDRKRQILDAALEVFSEKGYHGGSIRAIAKQAGITEGLIYHYFENKEALFNALVAEAMQFRDAVLGDLRLDKTLEENIANVTAAFMANIGGNPNWVKFIKMIISVAPTSDNDLKRMFIGNVEQGMQLIGNLIDLKAEQGELAPTNGYLTARLLVGGMIAFFIMQYILNLEELRHVDIKEFFENSLKVVFNGIKKR